MTRHEGRQEYLAGNRTARGWAALDHALNQQKKVTPGPITLKKGSLAGKRVVIIGSGVAGLTTAYELLAQESGAEVIVLEAKDRTGGRCLTLRTGDTFTEDRDSKLFGSKPGETQVVRFERPAGDTEPYLNAGPGRIPSSHKRLLGYLKRFGVEVEVYVMASGSNLTQMKDGALGGPPVVNRRLAHNTRGWIAEMVYQNADSLIESSAFDGPGGGDETDRATRVTALRSLMVSFGNLNDHGRYVVSTNPDGQDDGASDRAGYTELPGVQSGEIAKALSLDTLLQSKFWSRTRFYQPEDFLWQPTLFQPVGGMDRVQHAFVQQVAERGGVIHLNSPVSNIDWDEPTGRFRITADGHAEDFLADYCFSNMAIPFLKRTLSERLQSSSGRGFSRAFVSALAAVYKAQFDPDPPAELGDPVKRFLACTTKVGWQADRSLWQGKPITAHQHPDLRDSHVDGSDEVLTVDESEVGVVPIYGGISWTDDQITQIWYPSDAYHDVKGVLTGCYNFAQEAETAGREPVSTRLDKARQGARLFGQEFGDGLEHGVAIAWQNIRYVKGGWAQWDTVKDSVHHFNALVQGTAVNGEDGAAPCFFVVGDQVSSLPGWQEGAIASALNAISRLSRPEYELPFLASLPDTRLIVEGM